MYRFLIMIVPLATIISLYDTSVSRSENPANPKADPKMEWRLTLPYESELVRALAINDQGDVMAAVEVTREEKQRLRSIGQYCSAVDYWDGKTHVHKKFGGGVTDQTNPVTSIQLHAENAMIDFGGSISWYSQLQTKHYTPILNVGFLKTLRNGLRYEAWEYEGGHAEIMNTLHLVQRDHTPQGFITIGPNNEVYMLSSGNPKDSEKYAFHAIPYTNNTAPVRTFLLPGPPKDRLPPWMNFYSLSFSTNGTKAVMGPRAHLIDTKNVIYVWDVDKGGLPFVISNSFGFGSPEHYSYDPMAISRTGQYVAIGSLADRGVWIFSTETGNQHAKCQVVRRCSEIVASPAHDLFVVGTHKQVLLFTFDGKPIAKWDRNTRNDVSGNFQLTDIAFSPNGQYMAFASCQEGCIRVVPVPVPEAMKNAK